MVGLIARKIVHGFRLFNELINSVIEDPNYTIVRFLKVLFFKI